jgi:hypothetical protein
VATVYSDERGRSKLSTMRFLGGSSVEYAPKASAPSQRVAVPRLSLDPLSAIYVMRAIPFKPGVVIVMPVVDGSDIYQAKWGVAGPELVRTTLGSLPAWRLTPTLEDGKGKPIADHRVTLWISDDARRLPLRLQVGLPVGSFTLTLSHAGG